jgi:peroxiredoxin
MAWHSFSEDQRRRSAPVFCLPSTHGDKVELAAYRGRRNLVLFFPHGVECVNCQVALKTFAAQRSEYTRQEAEILAILPASVEQVAALKEGLALPFPLLADAQGGVHDAYTALFSDTRNGDAMVFVLDRYNAPYAALVGSEPTAPSVHREIIDWLDFIELQCPE